MKYNVYRVFAACVLFSSATGSYADNHYLPMPPAFHINAVPEKVLREYPLGVITRQAAFSHHGKAHKEFKLPNKSTGWLYDVGKSAYHRTYTLVFSSKGTVGDVLYYDHGGFSKYGASALLLQSAGIRTSRPVPLSGQK